MKNLNLALALNATFSLFCGLLLILFSQNIAQIFGTNLSVPFWTTGIALLCFSAILFYIRNQKQKKLHDVLIISSLDIIWVLTSLTVIVLKLFDLHTRGYTIIGLVAGAVAWFAVHQLYALTNIHTLTED